MNKCLLLCLALLAMLVTGCPHNDYLVELTPRGKVMERKLTFSCVDGTDTNGLPHYVAFSQDELRLMGKVYPADSLKREGQKHIATSTFTGAAPGDVGGAGSYTILTNSLGSAAYYVERFRGNDDIAARIQLHLKTADKLVDYIIGWSQKEFGGERHYQDLRRFLNGDFRQDMRNLSLHAWMLQTALNAGAPAPEEFGLRFGQYLAERGYFRPEDAPGIARNFTTGDSGPLLRQLQQLVAEKLRVPKSKPMPQALAFLTDGNKFEQSWNDYLAGTTEYRAKLRHWQMEAASAEAGVVGHKIEDFLHLRGATNAPPQVPEKPQPSEVIGELVGQCVEFNLWQTEDHLAVKLSLPAAPTHTNGKWDEAAKQVVWEASLAERTNEARLPVFCYASWAGADEGFQKAHFGQVLLEGDDLLQYSLWRDGLEGKRAGEWDAFMNSLRGGEGLWVKLNGFQFSDEPPAAGQNAPNPRNVPMQLFKSALKLE